MFILHKYGLYNLDNIYSVAVSREHKEQIELVGIGGFSHYIIFDDEDKAKKAFQQFLADVEAGNTLVEIE